MLTGDEPTFVMLVNEFGEIINEPMDLLQYGAKISPQDEIEFLKLGSVIWTFIDDDNNLNVAILPIPVVEEEIE
jgi:hypothetical protein